MKAEEKWSVSDKLAKTLCRFINKNLDGWKWMDIIALMLIQAEGVIKLCAREELKRCKLDPGPRNADSLTRSVMKRYAEMSKLDRGCFFSFADDEDELSSQQEKSEKTEGAPDDASTMPR